MPWSTGHGLNYTNNGNNSTCRQAGRKYWKTSLDPNILLENYVKAKVWPTSYLTENERKLLIMKSLVHHDLAPPWQEVMTPCSTPHYLRWAVTLHYTNDAHHISLSPMHGALSGFDHTHFLSLTPGTTEDEKYSQVKYYHIAIPSYSSKLSYLTLCITKVSYSTCYHHHGISPCVITFPVLIPNITGPTVHTNYR